MMRHIPRGLPVANKKLHHRLQPRSTPHPIHTQRPMTTPSTTPALQATGAVGSDNTTAASSASSSSLSSLLHPEGRWRLTPGGQGVERAFRFRTFKKTWEFMNAVADECKVKRHHPEWSNVYNIAFVRWTTHSPPGLSGKDLEMARFCDEQALLFGELVPEGQEGRGAEEDGGQDVGRELADQVALEGGDCCVPKPKAQT